MNYFTAVMHFNNNMNNILEMHRNLHKTYK